MVCYAILWMFVMMFMIMAMGTSEGLDSGLWGFPAGDAYRVSGFRINYYYV
jgi:hypothetical protein